ncbi:hypothetical protein QWY28_12005 [Nocardioides sp. SOB77]|uniref:DUF983 domain-containing protein n=1 Tax=Nocardioides oceani TaxID=3058369 RepID=A0ABT8FG63_9ACTN|nr:hypothetical protein [Nocardioides oceani]MDN4173674.1 hypothetical protein [Nocardioides oceani]
MKVKDPSGQTWRITRRWVPWRRRFRDGLDAVPSGSFSLAGDDPVSLVLSLLAVLLLLPFLLVVAVAWLELLVLLLVLPFAVAWRVARGRHWHVEARRGFTPWWEVDAGSWSASRDRIAAVADAVRRGDTPERTIDAPPLEHP